MCDVHLNESFRAVVPNVKGTCCYCGSSINGSAWVVRGTLDDGSPGIYEGVYCATPEDCLLAAEQDTEEIEENEGCFQYGEMRRVE